MRLLMVRVKHEGSTISAALLIAPPNCCEGIVRRAIKDKSPLKTEHYKEQPEKMHKLAAAKVDHPGGDSL